MKVFEEAGVLPASERFFSTPSAIAKKLFFYVTRCGHYYCSKEYDFRYTCPTGQEESHLNYEIFYIRQGALQITTDTAFAQVVRGQCALVDCRKPHRFHAEGDCETLWIHFDGANSADFFQQILQQNGGRFVLHCSPESHIERLMAQIISSLRADHSSLTEAEYSRLLYQILCELLYPTMAAPQQVDHPVTRAMRYITEHLYEDLPVERVAAAVNLSVAHFSRQFRAYTGFSPHEYIILHRIDQAKALLHDTDLSVKEVAFQVGYRSEVNFIASFKSKTGVSPTAFRRNTL